MLTFFLLKKYFDYKKNALLFNYLDIKDKFCFKEGHFIHFGFHNFQYAFSKVKTMTQYQHFQ